MEKVLIIDDDHDICRLLARHLGKNGYEAGYVTNGEDATKELKSNTYDLVLCDYKLPDITGIELLQKIRILNPNAAIIIITGYSDVRIAVKALQQGAYDYVTKPIHPDEILLTIKQAIDSKKESDTSTSESTPQKRKSPSVKSAQKAFVPGISPQSQTVQKHIELIAPTDMSVIITGETGTGKEFVANAIHRKSQRADQPFVAIDCGALPKELAGSELFGHMKGAFTGALQDKKGSFEIANGGTLFLDEIGNLSYDNQIKLLRVLQERKIKRLGGEKDIPVDVRIIVATNENLKKAIKENKFRQDIYHRLNEFNIELTPLRERPDDIILFAEHFLTLANETLNKDVQGFDEQVKEKLKEHNWHGNLRELQNVVKRSVLLCTGDYISLKELPEEIVHANLFNTLTEGMEDVQETTSTTDLKKASLSAERKVIMDALVKAGYNKSKAAKALDIDRKTLYNKIKAYEITFTTSETNE